MNCLADVRHCSGDMARSCIKQTDGRHPCTGRVGPRSGDEVAECRIKAVPQGLKRFQVDFGTVSRWAPLKRTNIFDDGGDCVYNTFHGLQDLGGRI